MKAIVTGAAGFIGSRLCHKLLDTDYTVTGIDCFVNYYPRYLKEANLKTLYNYNKFEFINNDILNTDLNSLIEGADVVFHLAAQAGVRASWGQEFEIYTNNNVLATQRLLESVRQTGLKKFIYASSSSVYGDTNDLPMTETSRLNPVSPYGVTKLAGENLCALYHRNFDLDTVSLRYFTVYGPGQRPDMAFHRLLKNIVNGDCFKLFGDGSQSRDFTHVDDIVKGTILAIEGLPGQVYNLAGGNNIDLNSVIRMMEELIGKKAIIEKYPVAHGDVRHTVADTQKAQNDIQYNPQINLKQGLSSELDWLISMGIV